MAGGERRDLTPWSCPEGAMAVGASKVLGLLAVPVVGGAWWRAGIGGAAGAAAGLALVLALFGVTGLTLRRIRTASPSVVVGVSLAGMGVRMVGYLVSLGLLAGVPGLHRPSLAAATIVAFVVTLLYECRMVHRTAGFFWVRAPSA